MQKKENFGFKTVGNNTENHSFIFPYIFEITVASPSISIKIVLDVAIVGYDYTTKKFNLHWED